MLGKIIGAIMTGVVGVIIAVMGWLLWKKEKLSLMHNCHVDKVSAENRPAFCKLSGIGLIVIGVGLLITAVSQFVALIPLDMFPHLMPEF